MGGVVGTLGYLYCRSGCQASVVASALAFHPPDPPFYELAFQESSNSYELTLPGLEVPPAAIRHVIPTILTSKNKTKIPIFLLKSQNARFTVLFSHGNAADIGAMLPIYDMLCQSLHVNIVAYDYTGYGASLEYGVRPTEQQTYQDIETVYRWCLDSGLVVDPSKEIVLYGQSVGSGPSCYLASKQPIAGLVLHSPILSGLRVLTPSRSLACFDIFPNIDRIKRVSAPVMIIHGEDDREVPFYHGQDLYNSLPDEMKASPWWVKERGHNDIIYGNEREYLRRLRDYLQVLTRRIEELRVKIASSNMER